MTKVTYKDAGVDIDAGDRLVSLIKDSARRTLSPLVLHGIGGFAACMRLPTGYKKPVLVSSADGVGTKLKLAFECNQHGTIGQDLVAMCVNDLITVGAKPLFFLDYFATGQLDTEQAATVIQGIAAACERVGCSLVGGETAELPGFYAKGEYDLAGFVVGIVEEDQMITGARTEAGDFLIGIASSGLHSNGYSLARRALLPSELAPAVRAERISQLLAPTKLYATCCANLLADLDVRGMAHITGGGVSENLPRILPDHIGAVIDRSTWQIPQLFCDLQHAAQLDDAEMFRTFNMGIGMIVVVPQTAAEKALLSLRNDGETATIIGRTVVHEHGTRVSYRHV